MPFDDGTPGPADPGAGDDDGGDDGHGGFDRFPPPPHPDDRLWRHPSELAAGTPPPAPVAPAGQRHRSRRAPPRRHHRPRGAILAVAAVGGAAVATAGLVLAGVRVRTVERTVTERVAVTSGAAPAPLAAGAAEDDAGAGAVDPAVVRVTGPEGSGSGFLLRDDGTVLTSAAVVGYAAAGTVPVGLADGRELRGRVRGTDPVTDVAVISLPDGRYPTVILAAGAPTPRGTDAAVVARHPDGEAGRSQGVVASTGWSIRRDELPPLDGLLQISTASDPAAHGGPVVDEREAVVGMTARSHQSWSYAVPIDVATKVVDDVLATGEAQHPRLGIEGTGIEGTGSLAAGVAVTAVAPAGPAEGVLAPGDVVVGWDGTPIPDMATLQSRLLRHHPGDRVEVTVHREGSTTPTRVEIELGRSR